MSGKKIKTWKYFFSFIVFVAIALCCIYFTKRKNDGFSLEVISTEIGYGYTISHQQQVYIYQPFIPAISGKQPFLSKEEAESVGKLIIERLKSGESHTVTPNDLKDLKIRYN